LGGGWGKKTKKKPKEDVENIIRKTEPRRKGETGGRRTNDLESSDRKKKNAEKGQHSSREEEGGPTKSVTR